MEHIALLVENLCSKDSEAAYSAFLALRSESLKSGAVYPYFDTFLRMLDDGNSYVRTRGLLLISANARWDSENQIDANLEKILSHVTDRKPIVSRQFIQSLPYLAECKPLLVPEITRALSEANPGLYRDSMGPLVAKDIRETLSGFKRMAKGAQNTRK